MRFLMIKNVVVLLIIANTGMVFALCNANIPLTRPDSRYEAVAGSNGAEVRDKVTKLIWQRCVQGMTWDGITCTSVATTMAWGNALLSVDAPAWRLPNHNELYSLAERACSNPAINTNWFPNTPSGWTWSSSPSAVYSTAAWVINFAHGDDYYGGGLSDATHAVANYVRLVRSAP